ncbi:MAG: sulfite exporter TauE/SafE family protein [Actinobacteria bacterium]|nr:sulfite exporter TauE/SafE family protein [Actinomycetota bacterium]
MNGTTLVAAALIGVAVGFLGGLLGKGGSAIATPLLHAVGVPAIVAIAAPLPATIPSTFAASTVYWRERLIDWHVVRWSIGFGMPATVAGAIATRWIGGDLLVTATDIILVMLGVRLAITSHRAPRRPTLAAVGAAVNTDVAARRVTLAAVAVMVGVVAGLLANSGGFLLAPLYMAVVHLPVKRALATSLAVSTVLAVPGTVVHASLGHVDWILVAVFAAASVPLSFVGARVAVRTEPARLERIYGSVLCVLGVALLAQQAV